MGMVSPRRGISLLTCTPDREDRMAWNGTARGKHRRGSDRH